MSRFKVSAGRAFIESAGRTIFDTDDGLFHVIGSPIVGSQAIATYNGGGGVNIDATDSYTLGTCNAACTDVIGSIKFTLGSYVAGLPFDRWHTMMGGSVLWVMDGQNLSGNSNNINITVMVWYSLRVTSGTVYLDRRIYFSQNCMPSYQILSHTIEYKLKAGLFT